jgi:hypothetical protein
LPNGRDPDASIKIVIDKAAINDITSEYVRIFVITQRNFFKK